MQPGNEVNVITFLNRPKQNAQSANDQKPTA